MSSMKTPKNKRKRSTSSSNESDDDSVVHEISKLSTPSPRKAAKRESTDSEDSEDDGVQIKGKAPLISPLDAIKHLEKIKEKNGNKDPSMKHAISSYCNDLKDDDAKEIHTSLTKYVHLAIQPTKLAFNTGSAMMNDFFGGPNALKYIPGFPHKPKNMLFCYAGLTGIDSGLGMLKEAAERMKTDEKGKKKAEKEAEQQREAYAENLQLFLEKNEEKLSEIQRKSVQMTIKRIDKSLHPEKYVREKKEKTPGSAKRKKKEPLTAFEHFMAISCTSLYPDMDAEKRLKKLQKKFDKLDPEVRDVYEKLALRD